MLFRLSFLVALFGVLTWETNGAKILFFFGVSTYSHRLSVEPLVNKMAERGDEVTFYQPIRPKARHPKVRDFFPDSLERSLENNRVQNLLAVRLQEGRTGNMRTAAGLPELGLDFCAALLGAPETHDWVRNSAFDLVIIDGLFNECAYGFAHLWGAKTIVYGTSAMMSWWYDTYGIPFESSFLPELHVAFPYPMSFWQRIVNTLLPLYIYLYRELVYYPALEDLLRSKLNASDMPGIGVLERKTSLILSNTHFSEEGARSLPPMVIPIGGMHCFGSPASKSVPKEIQDFISNSGPSGFIYVSFGSEAKIQEAPEDLRNIFYSAFAKIKARFVWKWDGERPKEMPPNVITADWLPQQAILALKPKIFITHGGLLSIQEAVTHGVPMLVFPIFAEQDYNGYRIERTGRGVRLEISGLTQDVLEGAIAEILKNKSYANNMAGASRAFKDRPRPPVDEALWWVDYVLRNPESDSLKPLAINQYWFQRRLLDVWAFVALVALLIIGLVLYLLQMAVRLLIGRRANSKSSPSRLTSAKGRKPKKE